MAADHYNEFIGKKFIALSVVLSLIFWASFTRILLPYVPVDSIRWQYVWAGFTAICLTGVFFLALHMFRLVFVAHIRDQK